MRTALILLSALWGVAASAATYTVDGVVTRSSDMIEPEPGVVLGVYPPVGFAGTLTYRLDGADAEAIPVWGNTADIDVAVEVGGWTAGFAKVDGDKLSIDSTFSSETMFRISPFGAQVGDPGETLAGSIVWSFAPSLAAPVSTYGDLRGAIEAGKATARMSFNGTISGAYVEFEFTERAAPVPLPTPALLMLAGIGALAGLRRHG